MASFEEFRSRVRSAGNYPATIVWEIPGARKLDEWFASAEEAPYPFLLESGAAHPRTGRWSFVGCEPFLVLKSKGSRVWIEEKGRTQEFLGNPCEELGRLIARFHVENCPADIPFTGGAVGFFSYDFGRHFERLPNLAEDDLGLPDMVLGFYNEVLVFDHLKSQAWFAATIFEKQDIRSAYEHVVQRFARWTEREKRSRNRVFAQTTDLIPLQDQRAFTRGVKKALDYIGSGDIFQVNLSQRFETRFEGDLFSLYQTLRKVNPSPFGGYFDWGEGALVSSSPERLVAWDGEGIETRPIAGTYPRGKTEPLDLTNHEALILDSKERAEHLMLVDLERNDLGRVSEYGSVHCEELMTLEDYSHVIHIVSQVRGKTRKGIGPVEILRALFPGGTITGTPKVRAMEIIDEIEPVRRGLYTGSMGYIGFQGKIDLNILIRTFVVKEDRAFIQVGAGVVADSDPDREYQETLHKAAALFKALAMNRGERLVCQS
jgi:para-aminobenzoate synthetase component I